MQRQDRTRQHQPRSVAWPLDCEQDVVAVDTTWGIVQRLHAAPDVPTVGELELVEMVNEGAVLIDCRTAGSYGGRTIPGSVRIPHDEIVNRQAELDRQRRSILYCNGPSVLSRRTPSAACSRPATPPRPSRTTAAACTTG